MLAALLICQRVWTENCLQTPPSRLVHELRSPQTVFRRVCQPIRASVIHTLWLQVTQVEDWEPLLSVAWVENQHRAAVPSSPAEERFGLLGISQQSAERYRQALTSAGYLLRWFARAALRPDQTLTCRPPSAKDADERLCEAWAGAQKRQLASLLCWAWLDVEVGSCDMPGGKERARLGAHLAQGNPEQGAS